MTAATTRPANGRAMTTEQPAEAALLDRVVEATAQHRYSLDEVRYMADATAKSGMFNLTASQAFVLMMLAEAEGIHPIQAVRRYDVIDGKPTMKAATMQAEFTRRGGKITWKERNEKACSGDFSHPTLQPDPLPIRITLQELIDTEVAVGKDGKLKKNYSRHPRSMLHARVISEAVRAIDPAIVVGLYTPEEVSDFDESRQPPPRQAPPRRFDPPPQAEPEPQPEPASKDFATTLQDIIDQAENNWKIACAVAKKPHKPLGAKGKALSRWQVCNGVVKDWIARKIFVQADVETDGKWDQSKAFRAVQSEWNADEERRGDMLADVMSYIERKVDATAKDVGINLDAQPAEESQDAEVATV